MKPTVAQVIACLDKIIASPIAMPLEVYNANQAKNTPAMLEQFLALSLSSDYPAWYYGSLLVSNLSGVASSLRIYTVMTDDPSKIYVNEDGVLVTDVSDSEAEGLDNLLTFSKGKVPWAYDWTILPPSEGNDDYTVRIDALYRKDQSAKSSKTTIH